jgi:hypothetical protein
LFYFKSQENQNEEWKKFKESYETLLKFSFLAQDEEQIANESKDELQNFYITTKLGVDEHETSSTCSIDPAVISRSEPNRYQSTIEEDEEDTAAEIK